MASAFDLDPSSDSKLVVQLFRNVVNVPESRKKIMAGTLNCGIVNPSLILNHLQLVVAANKCVLSEKITTKNIYTELLFNLSVSKNISQSLQKFGVDDKQKDILVVLIRRTGENTVPNVFDEFVGERVDIKVLEDLSNENEIRKAYKINDREARTASLLNSVVSKIAVKDFL